ncbi:MAG: hypothetical protein HQL60_08405 [Magnetococcales bacterium]|nr:hypothetical protein [Magnetococcales bacterium]
MISGSTQWRWLRQHKWVVVIGVCSALAGGCSTPGPSGVVTVVNPTPVYSLPVVTNSTPDDNSGRASPTAMPATGAAPSGYAVGGSVPLQPSAGKPVRGGRSIAAVPYAGKTKAAAPKRSSYKARKAAAVSRQPCPDVKQKRAVAGVKKAVRKSGHQADMSRAKAALPAVANPAPQK